MTVILGFVGMIDSLEEESIGKNNSQKTCINVFSNLLSNSIVLSINKLKKLKITIIVEQSHEHHWSIYFYLLQNAQVFNVRSFHRLLIGTYYQNK